MSDEKTVPILEFLRRRKGDDDPGLRLVEGFRKHLREQAKVVRWYGFRRLFNRHRFFIHLLCSTNHREEFPLPDDARLLQRYG